MAQHKNIVVAIDDSSESLKALKIACDRFLDENSRLHVLTVLPPIVSTLTPVGPIASAGAVCAVTAAQEAQSRADRQDAARTLKAAEVVCNENGVPVDHVSYHSLPPAGGASGVAETIVQFVAAVEDALLVLGHRGLGSVQRAMLGVIGLGSVSEYCIHQAHCPVVAVKGTVPTWTAEAPFKVAICMDDSDHSNRAAAWAIKHLVKPENVEVHTISVAAPVSLPIIDDTTADIAGAQARQWGNEKRTALQNAEGVCARGIDVIHAAGTGLKDEQLFWKALTPEGGASDVAASIVHYCKDNHVSLCVVGSHGYGAMTRSLRKFVGLGSVSDYCLYRVPCSVCVVKANDIVVGTEPAAGAQSSIEAKTTEHVHVS